jgi:hypothetical protein
MNALFSRFNLLNVLHPSALRNMGAIVTTLALAGLLALFLPSNAKGQIWAQMAGAPSSNPVAGQSQVPQGANFDWVRVFGYLTPSDSSFKIQGEWKPAAEHRATHFMPEVGLGTDGLGLSWDMGNLIQHGILGQEPSAGTFSGEGSGMVETPNDALFINGHGFTIRRADLAGLVGNENVTGRLINYGTIDSAFVGANGHLINGNNPTFGAPGVAAQKLGNATVNNRGILVNNFGSVIDKAFVNNGGFVQNNHNSRIDWLSMNGGVVAKGR